MKLFREVTLVFDDDSVKHSGAGVGVLPKRTLEGSDDSDGNDAFDPSWSGWMIFHDVFEHWFELEDPHFRGKYAFNVGGEMAAMGALWYFYDYLNLGIRLGNESFYYSPSRQMIIVTENLMRESVREGYCSFGYGLESNVPKQAKCDEELESVLAEYWAKWKEGLAEMQTPEYKARNPQYRDRNETSFARNYARSVTRRKIFDLHRYGWNRAKEDFPPTYWNCMKVDEFYRFWTEFCKKNSAEELHFYYKEIVFRLYHTDEQKNFQWDAEFVSHDEMIRDNFTIKSGEQEDYRIPDIKDPELALE